MSFESGGSSFRPFIPKVQGSHSLGDSNSSSGGLNYTQQNKEEEQKVDEVVLSSSTENEIDTPPDKSVFILICDYIKFIIEKILMFLSFKKAPSETTEETETINPF